ncbi:protein FAR1-RELATED SEQUENCE 2-like [Pistacia vera]|uniref:protein FAR1-RELATED SEQUENCE 2-like n=1 Tax=Pistacia vera TaxID=55513 RepID=UPI0012632A5F|nr:protein FAR1-RELATED SEQUENCE 2-like [Pistacia vera]
MRKSYCELSFSKKSDSYEEYQVLEDVWFGDSNQRVPFLAYFEESSYDIHCNCHLFEFRWILCMHAIIVLTHKRVSHVPDKYILRRWRKNINRCHTKIKVSYNRWSTNVEGQRFEKLSNIMLIVADMASNNEENCNMLMEFMIGMRKKLEHKESKGELGSKDGDSPPKEGNSLIVSPHAVHSKGHPSCKRKQLKVDEIMSTGSVQNLAGKSNLFIGQEDVNDEHVLLGEI